MGIVKFIINLIVLLAVFIAGAYVYEARVVVRSNDSNETQVKIIPSWWKLVPFLSTDVPSTIYPYVYFNKEQFEDYANENLDVWTESVLVHEEYHLQREQEIGPVRFGVQYVTKKDFRRTEEIAAVKLQMEFLKKKDEIYPIDEKAIQFSSATYLWMYNEGEAKEKLTELWNEI